MFITPVFSTGSTGKNDELIKILEEELQHVQGESPTIRAEYFGGPSVGVYNARQIKKDTILTSSLALLIIIVFISLVFKRKRSIPLIITPVLFGGLFALFLIFFIKGSISPLPWEPVRSDGYCAKLFHPHVGTSEPCFHRATTD